MGRTKIGQTTFEYAIIIGIVVTALTMMQVYIRRGIQAGIQVAVDEIGIQEGAVEIEPDEGATQNSTTTVASSSTRNTQFLGSGAQATSINQSNRVTGTSTSISNWEAD
jgi:hypothetical protein